MSRSRNSGESRRVFAGWLKTNTARLARRRVRQQLSQVAVRPEQAETLIVKAYKRYDDAWNYD